MPSRLIGKEVQIRLYSDWVEVYYKDHLVERMERVRGEREANVNYRHVIGSLVRKPGAFARYRFREQLFPAMQIRLSYDALRQWRGERADVEYVRILHLAATTMEPTVDNALALLLETGRPFDCAEVRDLAEPKPPEAPVLRLAGQPDLKVYDSLITADLAAAGVCRAIAFEILVAHLSGKMQALPVNFDQPLPRIARISGRSRRLRREIP